MNNQKKIQEILHSIQELILEAQNEQKLDLIQTKEIIEPNKIHQSKTENLKNNQVYNKQSHVNEIIKTTKIKATHLEVDQTKNNSYLKNSWKDLNFKKCQEKVQSSSLTNINIHSFENEIEKIFRDSLSFWVKKNLPDLIKNETALHTKKILENKLK